MKKIILSVFCISALAGAGAGAREHREHGAHEHGAAKLDIAFDKTVGKVEFKGAAEGVLGFEHLPRTAKDKKTLAEVQAHFEKDMGQMVKLDPSLKCVFSKELIDQVPEAGHQGSGEHSDFAATFNISCEKPPLGSKLTVDFSSFQLIHDLDVTVLVDGVQKSAEFKKKPVQIELK